MSEKPEALRFGVWRDRETEILRVSNTGEFLWHKDADARIANPGPDANPAMMHLFRALRRAEVVQAENERLREALEKIADASMSMHQNAAHMAMNLQGIANAALRREDV